MTSGSTAAQGATSGADGTSEAATIVRIGGASGFWSDRRDGGGPASHRIDPLGKGMAQVLLDMPIDASAAIAREVGA